MTHYDVLVVGGGTSGMMAAISAAEHGATVGLVEKNKFVGRKLLVTGNGRCNVTNNRDKEEIITHIPGNGRFLYSAFYQYDNYDIMDFFQSRGIKLKEEDHGRMFPITDKSRTIVNALTQIMEESKVDVHTNAPVETVLYRDGAVNGVKLMDGRVLYAHSVILSTGGRAMPKTGSTGDGYKWAKKAGHTIKELYPTEVPITSEEPFIQDRTLQGISLRDVDLKVINKKGKQAISHRMDMIFTHFGISGPAVLRCSMFVLQTMKRDKTDHAVMSLDSLPDETPGSLKQTIERLMKKEGEKSMKNTMKQFGPERYILFGLEQAGIDSERAFKTLTPKEVDALITFLKDFRFNVHGSLPIEKAFVTGGGVHTKEVNPKTLESKLMQNLYFTGEILDYNGYTGGYNITGAFITGRLAGMHAAQTALSMKAAD
ncbi:NAD(P)/FAD-dependent oxidoreductase [Alkalibacterium sp. s-m-22]|uniref:NAD(P)/FAD-dependent oxidoreductase n=1 Tax=Alkalibacterium indicireducens TaxID=398758 RepID=A0ABN1AVK1_9LACT